ncbi:uncharacterized protein TrAtP1_005078 [Trichoderma atroviride]|uniref:uncharacterized protein n=1 Tax=Hypocrea atroviridis TaxID=63577 RepID=UPI00332BF60D|nr:hypothetical protein TrAtP1_005078 [Trichoderma atroviride]
MIASQKCFVSHRVSTQGQRGFVVTSKYALAQIDDSQVQETIVEETKEYGSYDSLLALQPVSITTTTEERKRIRLKPSVRRMMKRVLKKFFPQLKPSHRNVSTPSKDDGAVTISL